MDTRDLVKAQLMDARDLDRTLDRMARQIAEHLEPAADEGAMALGGIHPVTIEWDGSRATRTFRA